jgi:hypothetical protein
LALEHGLTYFGFTLEHEREPLADFTPDLAPQIRRVLAEALARGEARHPAVPRNRDAIEAVRETWRRSGGRTPRFQLKELVAWYEAQLAEVHDLHQFRAAPLRLEAAAFVSSEVRAQWAALPGAVEIRERTVPIHYEVEETPSGPVGVARLVLTEKLARGLHAVEVPTLDRPLRFTVTRGARGAVRADSLEALHEALSLPWSAEESRHPGGRRDRGDGRGDGRGGPWSGRGGPKGRGGRSPGRRRR